MMGAANPTSNVSLDRSSGLRVAIIGAGISGIAAAYYLKRAKLDNFLVFESSGGPGGTWHDTRYPGAEVDVVCHLYSFGFNTHDWTQRFASRNEVACYLEKTIDEFRLRPHFRFDTAVVSATWSDEKKLYTLAFADGRLAEFEIVISCVGFLNDPLIPHGIDLNTYPGLAFHSSRWRDDIDMSGKSVGVVGTGSSAAQLIVEAAKVARSVTVFQRSPTWVLPKRNRPFTAKQRARYRHRWQYRLKFLKEFMRVEHIKLGNPERLGSRMNRRIQALGEKHLATSLAGRPDLIARLTPDHPIGGKRAVASSELYLALREPHVAMAPAVASMNADGLTDTDGNRHELDIVILATGFQAARYLSRLRVNGSNGIELHDRWHGEPSAFLGACVPGFPNFFMLYGPNSNSGSLVFTLECQAQFAAGCVVALASSGRSTVEVKEQAFHALNQRIEERLARSVYTTAKNYYTAPSGRIVTQWPFSALRFWWLARTAIRRSMIIR